MKLKMEQLSFSYSTKNIFCGLSFQVNQGEFVSFVGPSGCGKSTILNILAGILVPQKGKIYVDEQQIYGDRKSVV